MVLPCFQTESVEEPAEEDEAAEDSADEDDDDEEAKVEDETEKPKPKKVDRTVWDWVLINENKPLWTRKYAMASFPS